jgi:Zn-dependent protease with chaperone function
MNTILLPFVFTLLATALVPASLVWLALLRWRRLPVEPWTERARRLHPIRHAHAGWLLILPFTAIVIRLKFYPEVSLPAVIVGSILGSTLSGLPLDRAAFPAIGLRAWLKSALVLSGLRLGWVFLVLLFAFAMPDTWSLAQLGWSAAFLVASGALSAGLIYRVLVALGAFRPGEARITRLVGECSAETGVPVRGVWVFTSPAAYAAALVAQRALVFSDTTLAENDDEELRAICRHELAHLNEGRAVHLLRIAQMPLSLLPFIFTPTFVAAMGPLGILPPLLSWLVSLSVFNRLSLRMEKRADAAAHQGAESPAYARALERIHQRNLVPAVLAPKAARTHPDLYDRMLAAGITPAYARPAPPADHHWLQLLGLVLNIGTVLTWMTMS